MNNKKNDYLDYSIFNVDPTSFKLFIAAIVLMTFIFGLLVGASFS